MLNTQQLKNSIDSKIDSIVKSYLAKKPQDTETIDWYSGQVDKIMVEVSKVMDQYIAEKPAEESGDVWYSAFFNNFRLNLPGFVGRRQNYGHHLPCKIDTDKTVSQKYVDIDTLIERLGVDVGKIEYAEVKINHLKKETSATESADIDGCQVAKQINEFWKQISEIAFPVYVGMIFLGYSPGELRY